MALKQSKSRVLEILLDEEYIIRDNDNDKFIQRKAHNINYYI